MRNLYSFAYDFRNSQFNHFLQKRQIALICIINTESAATYIVKNFAKDFFGFSATAGTAISAMVNMFPRRIFYTIISSCIFVGITVLRPYCPIIFRFVRVFDCNKANIFTIKFAKIIYFIFSITVVFFKLNTVIL